MRLTSAQNHDFNSNDLESWDKALNALLSQKNQTQMTHQIKVEKIENGMVYCQSNITTFELFKNYILHTPTSLLQSMPYKNKNAKAHAVITYPEPITIDTNQPNQGFAILKKLFNDQTREMLGLLLLDDPNKSSWVDKGDILHTRPVKISTRAYNRFKSTLDEVQEILRQCSYADLRNAIAKDEKQHKYLPYNTETGIYLGTTVSEEDSEYFQEKKDIIPLLFGEKLEQQEGETKAYLYFNYSLLTKCMLAPEVKLTNNTDGIIQFSFKQDDFLCYLNSVLGNHLIYINPNQATTNPEDRTGNIVLIGNSKKHKQLATLSLKLYLDKSGSMRGYSDQMQQQVSAYLNNFLQETNAHNTQVSITLFSHEFTTSEQLLLSLDHHTVNPALLKFISDHYEPCGRTHLTQAIHNAIKSSLDVNTHSVNLVFTDGREELYNLATDTQVLTRQIHESLNSSNKKPAVICVGAGDADTELLTKVAESTGCRCINLGDDLSKFAEIAKLAKQYSEPYELFNLLIRHASQHVNDTQTRIIVKDGTLSLVPDTVYPYRQGSLEINRVPLELEPQSPTLLEPRSLKEATRKKSFFNIFGFNSGAKQEKKKRETNHQCPMINNVSFTQFDKRCRCAAPSRINCI